MLSIVIRWWLWPYALVSVFRFRRPAPFSEKRCHAGKPRPRPRTSYRCRVGVRWLVPVMAVVLAPCRRANTTHHRTRGRQANAGRPDRQISTLASAYDPPFAFGATGDFGSRSLILHAAVWRKPRRPGWALISFSGRSSIPHIVSFPSGRSTCPCRKSRTTGQTRMRTCPVPRRTRGRTPSFARTP